MTAQTPAEERYTPAEVRAWVRALTSVMSLVDRFGIAFTVLVLQILAVKWLGSQKTQDDFLRDLLFGEITKGRSLAIFYVILIVLAMFGVDTIVRARLSESREMKRLAKEKTEWQERALGTKLSHTDEV